MAIKEAVASMNRQNQSNRWLLPPTTDCDCRTERIDCLPNFVRLAQPEESPVYFYISFLHSIFLTFLFLLFISFVFHAA